MVLRRVLPIDGGPPRVETTFEATGKLLGVDIQDMGTYTAVMPFERVIPDGGVIRIPQPHIVHVLSVMASGSGDPGQSRRELGVDDEPQLLAMGRIGWSD